MRFLILILCGRADGIFILIGCRLENSDQLRYLIQNWWKKKLFVEVDVAYLSSCKAIVHFVKTPQTQMGQFITNMHDHVECEMLDAPENFAPEISRTYK
jgi:hypothetical protein